MSSVFFMPSINLIGTGCLKEAISTIQKQGFKKGLIVTGKVLYKLGIVKKVSDLLTEKNVKNIVFNDTHSNPTIKNIKDGLKILKENNCDFIISLGGGSPHDCAKGIALLATNGGEIADYEGLDKSPKPHCLLFQLIPPQEPHLRSLVFVLLPMKLVILKWLLLINMSRHLSPLMTQN